MPLLRDFKFPVSVVALFLLSASLLSAQSHRMMQNGLITYTQIDYPGAFATNATGINMSGDVVGTYGLTLGGESHGFLLRNGQFTSIDYPGAVLTNVNGINDAGLIVGTAITNITLEHAVGFIYDGQTFTTISYPGVPHTDARGINNAGDVVGQAGNLYKQLRAFKFSGGRYSLITPPGHYAATGASDINDLGDVVGYVANSTIEDSFVLMNGIYKFFPFQRGAATGINNNQDVATTNAGGFVVMTGGNRIPLMFPGSPFTQGNHISNAGQVAGFFDTDVANAIHGYVTSSITAEGVQ